MFALILGLAIIYRAVVKQACSCLYDPGGREAERKKRKQEKGYDKVTTSEDSTDDEYFVPPTLTVESEVDPEFDHVVDASTHSPFSAYSAYGDTVSLDQTYVTERGLGRVRLEVTYYDNESLLKVHVIEGDGLPSKEQGGAANFKIHLTLLPKREQRFKSKTKSRYSPKFDETFEFKDVAQKDQVVRCRGDRQQASWRNISAVGRHCETGQPSYSEHLARFQTAEKAGKKKIEDRRLTERDYKNKKY